MTNADKIRAMSNEELVDLLFYGCVPTKDLEVPDCSDGCEDFGGGCVRNCPRDKQEKNIREWLESEAE